MRIIFVGMNNKLGVPPLCSTTKTGKLIDRVIAALQTQLNLFGAEFLKSNLFDLDHFPRTTSFNYEWCERVNYTSDDIVICLGCCVQDLFKRSPYEFVFLGHPSAVWSNKDKEL